MKNISKCKGCGKIVSELGLKDGFCEECTKAMGRSENYERQFRMRDIFDIFTFEKDSDTFEKDSENHESQLGMYEIDDIFTFQKDKVKVSLDVFEINGIIYRISDIISAEYIRKRSYSWMVPFLSFIFGAYFMGTLTFFIFGIILSFISGWTLFSYERYLRVITNGNELLLMKNVRKGYIQKVAKAINEEKKNWVYKQESLVSSHHV